MELKYSSAHWSLVHFTVLTISRFGFLKYENQNFGLKLTPDEKKINAAGSFVVSG